MHCCLACRCSASDMQCSVVHLCVACRCSGWCMRCSVVYHCVACRCAASNLSELNACSGVRGTLHPPSRLAMSDLYARKCTCPSLTTLNLWPFISPLYMFASFPFPSHPPVTFLALVQCSRPTPHSPIPFVHPPPLVLIIHVHHFPSASSEEGPLQCPNSSFFSPAIPPPPPPSCESQLHTTIS